MLEYCRTVEREKTILVIHSLYVGASIIFLASSIIVLFACVLSSMTTKIINNNNNIASAMITANSSIAVVIVVAVAVAGCTGCDSVVLGRRAFVRCRIEDAAGTIIYRRYRQLVRHSMSITNNKNSLGGTPGSDKKEIPSRAVSVASSAIVEYRVSKLAS